MMLRSEARITVLSFALYFRALSTPVNFLLSKFDLRVQDCVVENVAGSFTQYDEMRSTFNKTALGR